MQFALQKKIKNKKNLICVSTEIKVEKKCLKIAYYNRNTYKHRYVYISVNYIEEKISVWACKLRVIAPATF